MSTLAIVAGIRRGLEDMKAGRVVSHKKAMRRLRATIARAADAKASNDRHPLGGSSG
jgi:predicted transcriptional regulator